MYWPCQRGTHALNSPFAWYPNFACFSSFCKSCVMALSTGRGEARAHALSAPSVGDRLHTREEINLPLLPVVNTGGDQPPAPSSTHRGMWTSCSRSCTHTGGDQPPALGAIWYCWTRAPTLTTTLGYWDWNWVKDAWCHLVPSAAGP